MSAYSLGERMSHEAKKSATSSDDFPVRSRQWCPLGYQHWFGGPHFFFFFRFCADLNKLIGVGSFAPIGCIADAGCAPTATNLSVGRTIVITRRRSSINEGVFG